MRSVSAAVQSSNPTSGGTGKDDGLFAILILVFVTPGGAIYGEPGGGLEFAMAVFLQFLYGTSAVSFFRDEGGKIIRSDLSQLDPALQQVRI